MVRYMGDFETNNNVDDCRVWASCLVNIDHVESIYKDPTTKDRYVKTFNTIEETFEFLERGKDNKELFYHNLKFDGRFILDYLLKNGYEYDEELNNSYTFKTLITSDLVFYQIEICHKYYESTDKKGKVKKKRVKTTIYDSNKKIPLPVKRIPKAFGFENAKIDVLELEPDFYSRHRSKDHKLTQLELDYVEEDTIIVARALKILFDRGMEKMTLSSDSLNDFMLKMSDGDDKHKKVIFRNSFPILHENTDNFIRKSYKGGYTYCNPKYAGKIVGDGIVFDVNSLYPSVMYKYPMPWGVPKKYNGFYYDECNENLQHVFPLFIQKLTCTFRLKKDHLPTIQLKNSRFHSGTQYLDSSVIYNKETKQYEDVETTLYLTSVDLQLFVDHYDLLTYEFQGGFAFRSRSDIFTEYIDYWGDIKKNATDEGERQIAKLHLNSLYGKFCSSIKSEVKIPYLSDDGVVKYIVREDEDREPIYTAIGSFITSYARNVTIRACQKNFDRFLYCDTDSAHLLGHELPDIEIDDKELGAWKCEGLFKRGLFLRAKTYMEEYIKEDGSTHIDVKCAGMPDKAKELVTFDNFKVGAVYSGKLRPVTVSGGVVLEEIEFTIR